jgi:phosphohistidine phosphatase
MSPLEPIRNVPQAGAVPFRRDGAQLQYLLVTSQRGHWIFPKGLVEPGESAEETAAKEAREEAGILGRILPAAIGSYVDRKWQCDCEVVMFLLEYAEDCEHWEEGSIRRRLWSSYDQALELLRRDELRAILASAHSRLGDAARLVTAPQAGRGPAG